ncbi:MAG TPA: hypothetical protein VMV91_14865 [Rhodocyclaceae bacterium]|nr:hypothetical protein [Rhodocyclaceae bacterium]
MAQTIQNPILKKIEAGIEAKIPPESRQQYMAIVVSGMQIMFSTGTRHLLMQKIQQPGDIVTKVSMGIAQLIGTIYNQAKGKMSVPEAIPAAITLAMQALDFAERMKVTPPVTGDVAAQVVQATAQATLKLFGIGRNKVQEVLSARQGSLTPQTMAPPTGAAPPAAALVPQLGAQ